jgi:hypothetical protein
MSVKAPICSTVGLRGVSATTSATHSPTKWTRKVWKSFLSAVFQTKA